MTEPEVHWAYEAAVEISECPINTHHMNFAKIIQRHHYRRERKRCACDKCEAMRKAMYSEGDADD